MNSVKDSTPAPDEIDGERGMPSVNARQSSRWRRVAGIATFTVAVLVVLAVSYYSYIRNQRARAASATPKPMQLTNAVPDRTFQLPPPPPPPQVTATRESEKAPIPAAAAIPVASSRPGEFEGDRPFFQPQRPESPGGGEQTERARKQPPMLDKSAAGLMVSQGKASEAHAERAVGAAGPSGSPEAQGALAGMLTATSTPLRNAAMLPHRDFLLAKGAFVDCALQTRLDTTVAGMTTCEVTRDIYGDTGKVLLIERGSIMTGEYQSNVRQGQSRIFVLWNRVKTPNGVVVAFDSPGADQLGGAGVPGYVNNHFWQRFGGAMLLSIVQDTAEAIANGSSNRNGQSISFSNSSDAAQNMAAEALRSTINIPPTITKNQGDRVGIFVARDLDFASVYDLRSQ